MKTNFLLITFVFFFSVQLQGQNRFFRRGNKAFVKGNYPEAISNLKQVKEKNPSINRKIAQSYFFQRQYKEAETYFQKIYDSEKTPSDLIQLSQIYVSYSNYKKAIDLLQRAREVGGDEEEIEDRILAIKTIVEGKSLSSNTVAREIPINVKGQSLGIANLEGSVVFSNQVAGRKKNNYQLFMSEYRQSKFLPAKGFGKDMDRAVDIGGLCFSSDGKTMYYTRWFKRKGKQLMEIVEAKRKNGKWKAHSLLPFNSRKYSCAYPFLTDRDEVMYFASDKKGGEGGMDLYVSHKRGKTWTEPVNLGGKINTCQDEVYPRILKDGKLWFASNGHIGYGKLDLYSVEKSQFWGWGKVTNAGYPYNSKEDDFSVLDMEDMDIRLFVSARDERGLKEKIYQVAASESKAVQVRLHDSLSGKEISDARVRIVKLVRGQVIMDVDKANQKGGYVFKLPESDVDKGILYKVRVSKQGYKDLLFEYYPELGQLFVDLLLKKEKRNELAGELQVIDYPNKKVAFKNIYFDSGSNFLSTEAKRILDRFYSFWKLFPDLHVKINAHTDSNGSAYSNLQLSLQRGNMARDYLVAKGMSQEMIEVCPYGEQFIINECVEGVECDESKHRENRRLELLFSFK
eukprot:TRINITY_DN179_c0_g1_i4.p1 TRINITY_DN179_c0_g1~~TRINITY_DN179_c0_g1_i4.p1  ORF type:complete len:626 (+),score=47.31 TRINITY_DN179_c0_g1_i4:630-2507(+)